VVPVFAPPHLVFRPRLYCNSYSNCLNLNHEGLNKYLRRFSERFARQTSFDANITDVFHRLQLRSDPIILSHRRQKYCSRCKDHDHFTVSCPLQKGMLMTSNSLADELDAEVESFLSG
jgi:hypothetical protein